MKNTFILLMLTFAVSTAFSQKVDLITINQLNDRIERSGKDTTFVINFWATWCKPCLEELPLFDQFQEQFKDQRLKVILISVDFKSKLKQVRDYIKKNKIRNEVYLLNEANQQEYIDRVDKNWSGTIPATLFIHKENRKFQEGAFTSSGLIKEYQNIK